MTALCEYCGKPFEPNSYHTGQPYAGMSTRFCSRDCSAKWNGDEAARRAREKRTEQRPGFIQLTRGSWVQVDDEDYEWASQLNWYLDSYGYAVRKPKSGNVKLHRLIMERMLGRKLLRSERVDHEDLNPLNCHRSNLRLSTVSQNGMNRGKTRRNTSGYKGVTWHKDREKWAVNIKAGGVSKFIGRFDDKEEAAYIYDQVALQLHGEFAHTNFEY